MHFSSATIFTNATGMSRQQTCMVRAIIVNKIGETKKRSKSTEQTNPGGSYRIRILFTWKIWTKKKAVIRVLLNSWTIREQFVDRIFLRFTIRGEAPNRTKIEMQKWYRSDVWNRMIISAQNRFWFDFNCRWFLLCPFSSLLATVWMRFFLKFYSDDGQVNKPFCTCESLQRINKIWWASSKRSATKITRDVRRCAMARAYLFLLLF